MLEAGILCTEDTAEEVLRRTYASGARTHNRHGLKTRLCGGVAACVFMLALFAPVSFDFSAGEIAANTALAGSGDGNFGNGRGNGGPNGKKPGKGNGDDDDDDDGEDDSADTPTNPIAEESAGRDPGADAAADMAEADLAEAIANSPAEGPMAGTPATSLPTISQVFSMGDEATVSAENELDLIANGWGAAN